MRHALAALVAGLLFGLGLDGLPVLVFVLAMLAGMLLHRLRESGRTPGQAATPARSS